MVERSLSMREARGSIPRLFTAFWIVTRWQWETCFLGKIFFWSKSADCASFMQIWAFFVITVCAGVETRLGGISFLASFDFNRRQEKTKPSKIQSFFGVALVVFPDTTPRMLFFDWCFPVINFTCLKLANSCPWNDDNKLSQKQFWGTSQANREWERVCHGHEF